MRYRIVDSKGPDYYNDHAIYATEADAEIALAEAVAWAKEESKREPSWAHARLCIEEVAE